MPTYTKTKQKWAYLKSGMNYLRFRGGNEQTVF